MSPFTAMFLSFAAVMITVIGTGAVLGLYALSIVDQKASQVLNVASNTVENLPALLQAAGPAVENLVGDRAAAYASKVKVEASFVTDPEKGYTRPALTITNNGDEVVTLMTVRVAALNSNGVAVADWNEVVATPIGIEDWPGPIQPGATRHMLMNRWNRFKMSDNEAITAAVETTELRVGRDDTPAAEAGEAGRVIEKLEAFAVQQ
jgi:hypothetical protein